MTEWISGLTDWLAANPEWLGLGIFLVAGIECLAVAGILVPGTVVLFALGVMAGSGSLGLWQTLLLAYFGGLLGDALSYGVGRRFHQNIRRLPVLRHHPEWIGAAELYFMRYGAVSLLVGRYIGPLRPMLPMVAGMLDMPFVRFMVISMIAAAGWSVAYLAPGWVAGAAMRLPLPEGFWSEAAVLAIGLAVPVAATIYASLHSKRWATPMAAGLSLALIFGLFFGWSHLAQLDQGLMTLTQEHRQLHLDQWMVLITRLGDYSTQFAVGALLLLLLFALRQWRAALFAGGVLIGTAVGNGLLKALFARARPDILLEPLTSYSFPSGHSSAAFALFLTLGVLAGRGQPPRWRLTWLLLASLPATSIALSRVYLGVHWPTDVLAGALLASSMCALSLTCVQWRTPMNALSGRNWWLLLPACLALLGGLSLWSLGEAVQLYRYAGSLSGDL
jgi:membrane protein DedA with SNARE-associated domain